MPQSAGNPSVRLSVALRRMRCTPTRVGTQKKKYHVFEMQWVGALVTSKGPLWLTQYKAQGCYSIVFLLSTNSNHQCLGLFVYSTLAIWSCWRSSSLKIGHRDVTCMHFFLLWYLSRDGVHLKLTLLVIGLQTFVVKRWYLITLQSSSVLGH